MKRGKQGSHVGMILSFVIFIGFLFFTFTILQPKLNFSDSKEDFLNYLELELVKNVSANFSIANININEAANPNKNCIIIQGFFIWSGFTTPYIKVKNANSKLQDSYSGNFYAGGSELIIDRHDKTDRFFKIYYSPKFGLVKDAHVECEGGGTECPSHNYVAQIEDNPTISCKKVFQTDYTVGLIKLTTEIFESGIDKLITDYNLDYNKLKTYFKIPADTEFAFSFRTVGGTIKKPNYNAPTGTNVFANEVPILYVNSSTDINPGFLNLIVW